MIYIYTFTFMNTFTFSTFDSFEKNFFCGMCHQNRIGS